MSDFIDLIYCENFDGLHLLAWAPTIACISKGDMVCIDKQKGFFLVSYQITVWKDSDTCKFITEALGAPYTVTDKYSHQELVTSGNGDSENE